MWHIFIMPSINLRELRNTRQLKSWLKAGQTVELRERATVLARIVPEEQTKKQPVEWPDFEARTRKIFGDRIIPAVNTLLDDRENSNH
jgi:antitoxin (DNA-binding transcriptional repressor) of toxin-antitoxin stability system